MINKVIHYCWFGRNKKPELALRCIESWKKYCPDYEIIEWNEDNFDINSNQYVKEAYESKKWAFVTDYVRLYVLVKYGGIYMDTDVEVVKSLDPYLENQGFSGFESFDRVPTGIMASEKDHPFYKKLLAEYDDRHFILKNGEFDLTTNVITITRAFVENGLVLNNTKQIIQGIAMYPSDYFCPKDSETKIINLTENTVTIHHFDGSWVSKSNKLKQKVQLFLGEEITDMIVKIKGKLRGMKR